MELPNKTQTYEHEKEVKQKNALIEQLKFTLTEREKLLKEKNAEIRKLQQQLQKVEENEDLRNRIIVLEVEVVERNLEIEKLKDEIAKLKTDNSKLENKIKIVEKELHEVKNSNSGLESKVQVLEKGNSRLESKVQALEKNVDSYMLYIGQITSSFSENAYCYVMGDPLYEDYYPTYPMADIEQNIHSIRDVRQREKAGLNWDKFQRKVDWKPEKAKLVKLLKDRRNCIAHPDLDKTTAQEAIEELHKQKALKGPMSKGKVQDVVDMWQISNELVY